MRDVIIVTVLCLVAAIVADHIWLNGKYFSKAKQELGLDISAARRQ